MGFSAFKGRVTGFAKDNNTGGAIHFEGNGNVDDSQFTNKTSGNGGTDSN